MLKCAYGMGLGRQSECAHAATVDSNTAAGVTESDFVTVNEHNVSDDGDNMTGRPTNNERAPVLSLHCDDDTDIDSHRECVAVDNHLACDEPADVEPNDNVHYEHSVDAVVQTVADSAVPTSTPAFKLPTHVKQRGRPAQTKPRTFRQKLKPSVVKVCSISPKNHTTTVLNAD